MRTNTIAYKTSKLFGLVPVQVSDKDVFKYFHMELESYIVSGFLAETLLPGDFNDF